MITRQRNAFARIELVAGSPMRNVHDSKMSLFHPHIWKQQLLAGLIYWIIIPASVLAPGMLIDFLVPIRPRPWPFTAVILIVAGAILIRRSTAALASYGDGTPSPFRPAKKLVSQGVYRLCRHPMWLGYDLAALGIILLLGSMASLALSFPIFITAQVVFLRKEEKILIAKFKVRYKKYQKDTPMLFPNPFSLFYRNDHP